MALRSFRGGVHPHEHKELSAHKPLETMPVPPEILLPLGQHLGKPAEPRVKKGDYVRPGQVVAAGAGPISAPVHSPVGGTVKRIVKGHVAGGTTADLIVIAAGEPAAPGEGDAPVDTSAVLLPPLDPCLADGPAIVERVRAAGIVGQGGAAFPTAVKLSPPPDKKIDWLIINGAECEPYLTRDYRLMLERTEALVEGIELLGRPLVREGNADGGVLLGIGIENNKPDAIAKVREAIAARGARIEVFELRTKYPQGAEKMLIDAATGRKVPPGALPMEVGCVIQNVGTALAVRDAVIEGKVPTTAALTVSGLGVVEPKNLYVTIGTPIGDVIRHCGGAKPGARRVIVGGPMMGFAAYSFEAPVVKATSGILVLTDEELKAPPETACLNCGKCSQACPVNLLPGRLARLSELGRYEDARDLGIEVCMECGTCAFTCPASKPLVQYLRLGKKKVRALPRKEG
jgi:Na+-translocating ferredoxin:NAD+ oxidoreductase subunit C